VRAQIHGDVTARLVNLDGSVAAEARDEIVAPVTSVSEVFVLDLDGRNRYVMTTAATLEPLLTLPVARIELDGGIVRNTGVIAALGVVIEAQPGDELLDNVLDLLPGESRDVGAAAGTTAEGWNARS
jgi:hypothetical protein